MALGDRTREAREALAEREAATAVQEAPAGPKWTVEQLTEIVSAGMSVADARALLQEGFAPDAVLELAKAQAARTVQAAADTQTATAKAMQKAMKPENEFHPDINAFSYPEGERARPKVKTPYAVFYNGYPASKFLETQHWRECELMAQVQPGQFSVLRRDGTKLDVTVTAERDADGKITKLDIRFPVSREEKFLVPPMMSVLYQLVHQDNPRQRFIESMNEFMTLTLWSAA